MHVGRLIVAITVIGSLGCPLVIGLDEDYRAVTADAGPLGPLGRLSGIAAGGHHTCAWSEEGNAVCWGANNVGQLGDGTTRERFAAVRVVGLGGPVRAMAVGKEHSCAVVGDGVQCWGANNAGQLGNGTTTPSVAPVAVADLAGAVALTSGRSHACAILESGEVRCWGEGAQGQLGGGSFGGSSRPIAVPNVDAVRSVAAGDQHTCAGGARGVFCWGSADGLGVGAADASAGAVQAIDAGATSVAAGRAHSCATVESGAFCWGNNSVGQLGTEAKEFEQRRPAAVAGGQGARSVVAGALHTCVTLRGDGGVRCFGDDGFGQLGAAPGASVPLPAAALLVAAGEQHTCALLEDRAIVCWGTNANGELGDGTNAPRDELRRVVLP